MSLSEALLRAVKWVVSVSLMIVGIYFLVLSSENNDIRPLIICVFAFGGMYLLYRTRSEIPKPVVFFSIIILLGTAAIAKYLDIGLLLEMADMRDNAWGDMLTAGYYRAWWMLAISLGFPVMLFAYKRWGRD